LDFREIICTLKAFTRYNERPGCGRNGVFVRSRGRPEIIFMFPCIRPGRTLEEFVPMKSILSLVAICAVVTLAGCQSNKAVAPGAVGEKCNSSCEKASGCCKEKASQTNMGAVSEKKAGCCADKAAGKTCPVTGKTETVSPGAVSDNPAPAKSGCCASKKSG
jgi:hypothetical protein